MYGVIAFSISRKLRVYAHLSEDIFRVFGFKDVEDIDLYDSSKAADFLVYGRQNVAFQTLVFKYKE